jgi:hypothetical protein
VITPASARPRVIDSRCSRGPSGRCPLWTDRAGRRRSRSPLRNRSGRSVASIDCPLWSGSGSATLGSSRNRSTSTARRRGGSRASSPTIQSRSATCAGGTPSVAGPAGQPGRSPSGRPSLMIDPHLSTLHDHIRSHRPAPVRSHVIMQSRPIYGYNSPRSCAGIGLFCWMCGPGAPRRPVRSDRIRRARLAVDSRMSISYDHV